MLELHRSSPSEESAAFIPTPPNIKLIPASWFKDLADECRDHGISPMSISWSNGEEEVGDFVFDGINPENLHDTSKVKIKSFTFSISGRATPADVELANTQFKERILEVYRFFAKYDPNLYTKSLGIETPAQKLERIVRERDIDLEWFLKGMEELNAFYEPGTEDYEYQLEKTVFESGVPNTPMAISYILDLVKQVRENEVAMYKATHVGNNIHQGFSQLSNATNNVAVATLELAKNTLQAGIEQADATDNLAIETKRVAKVQSGGGYAFTKGGLR